MLKICFKIAKSCGDIPGRFSVKHVDSTRTIIGKVLYAIINKEPIPPILFNAEVQLTEVELDAYLQVV